MGIESDRTYLISNKLKDFNYKEELDKCILELYESNKTMLEISKRVNKSKIYVSKVIHSVYTPEEIKKRQYDKLRGKSKLNFSMCKGSSGIYRVSFVENKRCGNDYWSYQYYDEGKLKRFVSVNLFKLKSIVLSKGLEWFEFTDEASDLVSRYEEIYDGSPLFRTNKTGFYRVTKRRSNTKQGYTWAYSFKEDNKLYFASSVDISKLKSKVLDKGWVWIELNDDAKQLVKDNENKV